MTTIEEDHLASTPARPPRDIIRSTPNHININTGGNLQNHRLQEPPRDYTIATFLPSLTNEIQLEDNSLLVRDKARQAVFVNELIAAVTNDTDMSYPPAFRFQVVAAAFHLIY